MSHATATLLPLALSLLVSGAGGHPLSEPPGRNPLGDSAGGEAGLPSLEDLAAAPAVDDTTLVWKWKNGIRFETADGRYRFRLGGRIHFDAGWFSGDELNDAGYLLDDGSEMRRARLYMSGELADAYYFKAEYDFAGSVSANDERPALTDVYVGRHDVLGSADLQVGHFKEPFGLEQLTGANHLTFMERSSADALVPKRNDGLMLRGNLADDRMTWAAGVFRADTDNAGFSSEDGGYAGTARLTWAPVLSDEGTRVLHLGIDYSRRDMEGARFRSRPEAHLPGNFVDTGTIANDDVDLYGVELAGVVGPFSAQAEYVQASTSGSTEADLAGWYVEASWFVTGEHRPYETDSGAFGRVKPSKALGDGGPGAWQLTARVSNLDLDDSGVTGGELDDISVGVNWHFATNARLMFDYVLASLDDPSVPADDDASLFMIRLQTDW